METVIETRDLTKEFRGKPAVNRLDLAVPRGAVFALLGDNGAGKTTTIRMLVGQLRPDEGRATVLGKDCWSAAVKLRHRIGYVPERPKFYDWMTVAEIGWFTAGFHAPGFLGRYRERTTHFQLDPKARLQSLSKGEYAKVALALALAPNPEVLILDEPTSGLDLFVRREFLASMVGLAEEGRTILISSHQVAEVERVASHVAFLSQGRLLLTATVDDLRRRIVRVRMRCEGGPPDAASLGTVLQRNGTGKQWQAVLQDPDRAALDALRSAADIFDVEETPLALEEVYCALLARKEGPP
jgi:ABC-2 type transport system ATP-binding protein